MTTATSTMSTRAVAARLTELCRKGEFETAQKELYADDAVSIEPYATDDFEKETRGLDKMLQKGEKFQSMVEAIHGIDISDPIFGENSFAFSMNMDITMKQKGSMKMSELCVYEVKDGKIISEQFFM
ncbi:MAG TPA: SnoaL-like domain-containing protein [Chitinophaga sp.]|uniref:SnoaL-like domain-containing protein n=1 Tax=Chitinophaga sp. TaxID=1869181 RepID=UPI002F938680